MNGPRRDYEALGAGLLAPLRGLVPSSRSGEARGAGRVCNECHGTGQVEGYDASGLGSSTGMWGCSGCSVERDSGSREWSAALANALAADPDGVVAVEALIAEAASRLAFVPGIRAGTVRWSVVDANDYYWKVFGTGRAAWLAAPPELWPLARLVAAPPDGIARGLEPFDRSTRAKPLAYSARTDLIHEACWDELAARGDGFYAANPNPFTPLVDIWARGYVAAGWELDGPLYVATPPLVAG